MMPGQEKFLMEYYQKNPSAVASLRGNIYEEKIIEAIKSKSENRKKLLVKKRLKKFLKQKTKSK